MVSFRPSLIRSRSCSSGASLLLSLSGFPLPIRFLSSASLPVPATQPLFLPFRSSRPRLTAASPVRPSAFASLAFPVLSSPVSRAFFPGSCTRLSVCFLSPFPDSLPQLFLRCLPYAFAFGLSPFDLLSFVRFSSGSGYSAFCFFLSVFFPFLPQQRLLRCTNFCFRFVGFPRSFKTRFPVFSFPVFVLGFL